MSLRSALLAVITGGVVITNDFGTYSIKILRHDKSLRGHGTDDRFIAGGRRLEAQVLPGEAACDDWGYGRADLAAPRGDRVVTGWPAYRADGRTADPEGGFRRGGAGADGDAAGGRAADRRGVHQPGPARGEDGGAGRAWRSRRPWLRWRARAEAGSGPVGMGLRRLRGHHHGGDPARPAGLVSVARWGHPGRRGAPRGERGPGRGAGRPGAEEGRGAAAGRRCRPGRARARAAGAHRPLARPAAGGRAAVQARHRHREQPRRRARRTGRLDLERSPAFAATGVLGTGGYGAGDRGAGAAGTSRRRGLALVPGRK